MRISRLGSWVLSSGMPGIGAVMLGALAVGSGCLVTDKNWNYCSNINGDDYCAQRHGGERPFCVYGSGPCLNGLPPELKGDPSFDGCVESEPQEGCYSPCGGGQAQEGLEACVGGGATGAGESGDTGSGTESTGGTTSEVSADGSSTGTTSLDETSTGGPASECGNGVLEDGEECDGTDVGEANCENQGFHEGTLSCTDECTLDTSECRTCGNGILEAGEDCDGTDYGGATCESQGFSDGVLSCDGCAIDASGCTACGNGHVEPGEQCDEPDHGGESCISLGFSGGALACNSECWGFDLTGCTLCGNGIVETGEVCDGEVPEGVSCTMAGFDGGVLACAPDCASVDESGCYNSQCGNEMLEPDEICDGDLVANGLSCEDLGYWGGALACNNCVLDDSGCNNCGNGIVDPGEVCDVAVMVGASCVALGFENTLGSPTCAPDCLGYTGCTPLTGDCCSFHPGGGCSIPMCTVTVCEAHSSCCMSWSNSPCVIAAEALEECGC